MVRGRRPKPTALVELHGRTNRARKPRPAEPKPVGELSSAPDWLTPDQKNGWQYCIENAPLGLLKRIDRTALAAWCVAEDLHRRAAIDIAERGMLIRASNKDPESMLVPNPSLSMLNKQAMMLFRAMADLGFSPVSRPRIGQQPAVDLGPSLREATNGSVVSLDEYLRTAPPD